MEGKGRFLVYDKNFDSRREILQDLDFTAQATDLSIYSDLFDLRA